MVQITPKDEELIALLRVDAREPVASLARKLGLSRTTVQDRLRGWKDSGIIAGLFAQARPRDGAGRHARLRDAGGGAAAAGGGGPRRSRSFPQIETLHTVSGKFDLVAQVKTGTSEAMDRLIDEIGLIPGITRIETCGHLVDKA